MPFGNFLLHFSIGDLSCQLLRALFVAEQNPPFERFNHQHPFVELHYVTQGRYHYICGQTTYEVGPNQLLLFPPGTEHMLTQVFLPTRRLITSVHIQPPPNRAQGPSRRLYAALHASAPLLLDVPPDSPLAETLNHMANLARKNALDFSLRESMRAYAALLLASLSGALAQDPAPAAIPTTVPPASAPQSFLIDQFFYHPTISQGGAPALAKMLHVSPRQLDRVLLEVCGMNFREKMNQTKLEYAMALLSNRERSIDQIAHLLGYSSATTFGAFIKNVTGKTPTQLRRTLLAEDQSL